ncbi:hypothetical protein GQ44DRAFT_772599 [Phaeosphaeriaceae sp. PMI808]|nr:hypothetical protein GQ44DRAFT_772599 [Phaeosphaeriaceae sp. PMI808]
MFSLNLALLLSWPSQGRPHFSQGQQGWVLEQYHTQILSVISAGLNSTQKSTDEGNGIRTSQTKDRVAKKVQEILEGINPNPSSPIPPIAEEPVATFLADKPALTGHPDAT